MHGPDLPRGERQRPKRYAMAFACAAISATLLVSPRPAVAETLSEVLAATYRYNPRLDAARAALRATDEEVARANAGFRPNINATADIGVSETSTKPEARTDGRVNPKGYGITASQPVFRGFRTVNSVHEAEATVRAGRENLRIVEQAVMLDAITAYMDTIRDTAIVKIRELNVDVLTRELRATQERFRVGEVTRTDTAQAEARRAGAVSALDLARSNVKISRSNFERHVGRSPSNLAEPKVNSRLLPRTIEDAVATSEREHPSIVASFYREKGARHTVDRIWGELLPTLQVDASYSRRFDPNPVTDQTETGSVVARLSVPIYTNGEVQARVRQAKHTHVSRIQEIEQNRGDIRAIVVQAWSQLGAAKAQLESDNAQVAALSTAVAGVREEEKVGQRTLLDILNTEQELRNAQVSLASTKRNIVVTSYSLLAAMGRLNIQELQAATDVYDPSLHGAEVRRKWWGVSITHADGRREAHDFWNDLGRNFESARGDSLVAAPRARVGKGVTP